MTNDQADYYSGITSITVNGKNAYELKGKFLDDLHKNAFSGTNGEDAVEHIEYFLKIVDPIDLPNVNQDKLRVVVFPISLKLGSDEIEPTNDEASDLEETDHDDEQEIGDIFRIETNLFNYETPLCEKFKEFNYLLKIDSDVLTNDIEGFKTYEEYKDDCHGFYVNEYVIEHACLFCRYGHVCMSQLPSWFITVGIKRLLEVAAAKVRVTAVKHNLVLVAGIKVNAASMKVTTAERLQLLEQFLLSEGIKKLRFLYQDLLTGDKYGVYFGLVTADENVQKKNDVKARSMLLMALPNEYLLTFNQYKDAKTLFASIQTRFGGFRRLNKPDLDTMSFDDLYNNFKIVKQEVTQVNTASTQVSTANLSDATVYAFLANQPNGSQLVHKDLEQIHEDDLEEIDLKWQLALLSMRTRRECKGYKNQDSRNMNQDSSRRTINVEETSFKAMLAIDGAGLTRAIWQMMNSLQT
ncbi:hypothetical protein Tco_0962281 [Tanacetum coccineum]